MAPVVQLASSLETQTYQTWSGSKLAEIPHSNWPRLRDLYAYDWPRNMLGFYAVDTFLRWREQKPDIENLVIYSLDGDWKQDGTCICIYRFQVFASTLNTSVDRLERALRLLDWSVGYNVALVYTRLLPAFNTVEYNLQFDKIAQLYYISKEKAIQLEICCPPGIVLEPLREEHAETIEAAWPNHSLYLITQLIAHSPNVGAYDADGQLVAWCLRFEAGPHCALQVLDTHQRRGLGLLVCKALAKKLAGLGMDSCACVTDDNTASIKTFERAGFHLIDDVVRTKPAIPTNWRD